MISPFITQAKARIPAIRVATDAKGVQEKGAIPTAAALEAILKCLESIPDNTENTDEDINVLEAWAL